MAVGRQFNWKGQMRVDVPHLRAVESSIAYDFDTLAGQALGGGSPYVLKGFTFASWTVGMLPQNLQLITAGGVMFNYLASENGSMLFVPAGRTPETLAITNSRVSGGFTANAVNYVGIDFTRLEDATTADVVQFLDATTLVATPKTIPLGRTLDYKIYISTTPFSGNPNQCPIAKVTVDANGYVSAVEDARTMYFRLALGGDAPNPLYPFDWSEGRAPESTASFSGGDKAITNEKQWKSAIMQRLWEITGGEYWYSDVTDRNMKFYAQVAAPVLWVNPTLTWDTLYASLDNSTATTNTITAGNHNIVDGEVGYVEVDRYTNATLTVQWALTPAVYNALPPPTRPGSRFILFWRKGAFVFSRFDYTPVGVYSGAATTASYGLVKTSSTNAAVGGPFAVITNTGVGGFAVAEGLQPAVTSDPLQLGATAGGPTYWRNSATEYLVADPILHSLSGWDEAGALATNYGLTLFGGLDPASLGTSIKMVSSYRTTGWLFKLRRTLVDEVTEQDVLSVGSDGAVIIAAPLGTGTGLTVTGGVTDGVGIRGNGNAAGSGVAGFGGATNGIGVDGVGGGTTGVGGRFQGAVGGNARGITALGTGSGYAIYAASEDKNAAGAPATAIFGQGGDNAATGVGVIGGQGISGHGGDAPNGTLSVGGTGVVGVGGEGTGFDGVGVHGISTDNAGLLGEATGNGVPLRLVPLAVEPPTQEGAIYYNSVTKKFRGCTNVGWEDLNP